MSILDSVKKAIPLLIGIMILFGIIIWDMDKQYHISQIIHDDHSSGWHMMNTIEMYDWFTDVDLCSLRMQINSTTANIKQYRLQNCTGKGSIPNVAFSNKIICAVGMTLGKSCEISDPAFYLHKLSSSSLGPSTGNLNRALIRITYHKIPIVFIGDALSKQNEESLICEAIRTNVNGPVSIRGNLDLSLRESFTNVTLTWKSKNLHLRLYFLKASAMRPSSLEEIQFHMDELQRLHPRLVVIANIGANYFSREKFRADIDRFLVYLNHIGSRNNLVLFRETAAQHWNSTSHGYLGNKADKAEAGCGPLEDASPDLDWKNKDVKNVIMNEHLRHIRVVPFRDITAPLFNMHVPRDCSQFCYFPQLWQVVFYHLEQHTMSLEPPPALMSGKNATKKMSKFVDYMAKLTAPKPSSSSKAQNSTTARKSPSSKKPAGGEK